MDEKTTRCHRLICAVITLAVKDLTCAPIKKEKSKGYVLHPDALSAMNFFFKDNVSDFYLTLIGYDPGTFKKALTKHLGNHRRFLYNFDLWCKFMSVDRNFKPPLIL